MRRKQWVSALHQLRQAEKLAPQVPGIRLNIGLVYYRQNDFRSALAPFESVLRDDPNSYQARYLLGLCYFFVERYADAADSLQPLWPQASLQMNYLYVLGIAAHKAQRDALEQQSLNRLIEVGQGSAEFHLLMGKAHLNRQEYDQAIVELEAAAKSDSSLPFVHFNLGLAYLHQQQYEQAKQEFERDIAIEPDVAFDYDELASVFASLQDDRATEKNYRQALRLDPNLVSSHFGLAKLLARQQKLPAALAELDQARALDPQNSSILYLRGQVLLRLGRKAAGQAELTAAATILNQQRAQRRGELEGPDVPSPELTKEPQ